MDSLRNCQTPLSVISDSVCHHEFMLIEIDISRETAPLVWRAGKSLERPLLWSGVLVSEPPQDSTRGPDEDVLLSSSERGAQEKTNELLDHDVLHSPQLPSFPPPAGLLALGPTCQTTERRKHAWSMSLCRSY